MSNKTHSVHYTVPLEYFDTAQILLSIHANEGWEESVCSNGDAVFIVHTLLPEEDTNWHSALTQAMQEECKATYSYTVTEPVDWIELWKSSCTPVIAGDFYIVPEWYTEAIPEGQYPIYITPKMAFGTGHHSTTALCLQIISAIRDSITDETSFGDIGTGSGILAIALAHYGATGIAVDIDSIAVENAQENALLNGVHEHMDIYQGDIYAVPERKYSCIVANILAQPLLDIAEDIVKRLPPKGILILSGILISQATSIIEKYQSVGIQSFTQYTEGEWVALLGYYT